MNKDKIKEALTSIHSLVQQLEREGTVAEWVTETFTKEIIEAIAELEVADSPDMDGPYQAERTDWTEVATLALDLTEAIWTRVKGIEQHELTNLAERCIYKGVQLGRMQAGRSSLTGIKDGKGGGDPLGPHLRLGYPHGGGDAVQSDGPRSAAVPSEADRPAAAPPIAIAKDKKRPFDLEKLRKEVGHQPHFFPSDVYPHNSRFKRWCQKQAALGNLIRHGEHGDRWGYNYSFPSLPSPPSQAPTP